MTEIKKRQNRWTKAKREHYLSKSWKTHCRLRVFGETHHPNFQKDQSKMLGWKIKDSENVMISHNKNVPNLGVI